MWHCAPAQAGRALLQHHLPTACMAVATACARGVWAAEALAAALHSFCCGCSFWRSTCGRSAATDSRSAPGAASAPTAAAGSAPWLAVSCTAASPLPGSLAAGGGALPLQAQADHLPHTITVTHLAAGSGLWRRQRQGCVMLSTMTTTCWTEPAHPAHHWLSTGLVNNIWWDARPPFSMAFTAVVHR